MEKQANTKRMNFSFQTHNLVLLKMQPYLQSSIQKRSSQKLAPRFFGPFSVIKWIEEVAYLLDIPSSSWIHSVVHVSLLRPYFGKTQAMDFRPLPPHHNLTYHVDPEATYKTQQ